MRDGDLALRLDAGNGFCRQIADGADGHHSHLPTRFQPTSFTYGQRLHGAAPIYQHPTATGVADDEGPLIGQLGRVHQVAQLVLIHWRSDGEVGDRPQIGHIESPMMGRTILAHQSGPVKTEHHRQA